MKLLKALQTGLLGLIGLISVFMTLSVLFDKFGIRAMEGNYVPFVVYANLICGVLYLATVAFNYYKPKISLNILLVALAILAFTFAELFIYIKKGGLYETKTIKAMAFRFIFTGLMAWISLYLIQKGKENPEN